MFYNGLSWAKSLPCSLRPAVLADSYSILPMLRTAWFHALLVVAMVNVQAQSVPRASSSPLGSLVDVGGYRLHLYCTGSGSPTVIITGAGYSFDWGLVQPELARHTRVCSYDPAGSAWSDPPPHQPSCVDHIDELHRLLSRGGLHDKLILVGHSIGAVFARLYAERYPREVAGLVFVDHAAVIQMTGGPGGLVTGQLPPGAVLGRGVLLPPGTRVPPSSGAGTSATYEDDSAFQRLPAVNRSLHEWANALPSTESPRAQRARFDQCFSMIDSLDANRRQPLGGKPLVVIGLPLRAQGYIDFQHRLLALSSNSMQLVADSSGHLVPLDQPSIVIRGVESVVRAVRARAKLRPT